MAALIRISDLAQSLNLVGTGKRNHVAIVGGGGKTSILHALGEQLLGTTVLTSTTKMGAGQHQNRQVLLSPEDDKIQRISAGNPVMVWREIQGDKAIGVDKAACDRWFRLVDNIVVEADGARRRPFKAPADFEPVVADSTTLMISTIGADALGKVISDQCHRPLLVAALARCESHERLTPVRAAEVILHDQGHRKEIPPRSRFCVAITKVDDANMADVEALMEQLHIIEDNIIVVPVAFDASLNEENQS
jgi:probable selenium-dependent hydroxylase accessory protein YqeC